MRLCFGKLVDRAVRGASGPRGRRRGSRPGSPTSITQGARITLRL
jgi:hypothetical protein